MNNKTQIFVIAAIVVLAVAVTGLYLASPVPPGEKTIVERVLGGDSNFDCIGFRGGDYRTNNIETSFCVETIKMASGTSTLVWDNLTGEERYVDDIQFGIVGSDAAADSFVVFVATTTIPNSLRDPSDGAALVLQNSQDVGGEILNFVIATGTQATTTKMSLLKELGVLNPAIGEVRGRQVYQDIGFRVGSRERLVVKLYNFCNIYRVGGQATCAAAQQATSTSRGFDLKVWVWHHD